MIVSLNFLRVSANDTPYVVVISVSDRKSDFMIECPDGTQRALQNSVLKVRNIKAVFLTKVSGSTSGGLLGMSLTRMASGTSQPLNVISLTGDKIDSLSKPRVDTSSPIAVQPLENGPVYDGLCFEPVVVRGVVIGVRVVFPPLPPKFDGKKANSARVPNGAIRGRLAKGEDVDLGGGLSFVARDFLIPQIQPGEVHILTRLTEDMLDEYTVTLPTSGLTAPHTVVLPMSICSLSNGRGLDWLHSLKASCPNSKIVALDPSSIPYPTYHQLNLLRSSLSPAPGLFVSERVRDIEGVSPDTDVVVSGDCVLKIIPVLDAEPTYFTPTGCNVSDSVAYANQRKMFKSETVLPTTSPARSPLSDYPQIVFLGTGAMYPSRYRNVSSILIKFSQDHNHVLVDCGEDSLGQLVSYCDDDQTKINQELDKISCVFITHEHADHNLGLWQFAKRYREVCGRKLRVVAQLEEEIFRDFVFEVCGIDGTTDDMECHNVADFTLVDKLHALDGRPVAGDDQVAFCSFPVPHSEASHGYLFYDGISSLVVVSGDTQISIFPAAAVKAVKSIILRPLRVMLVHEATLDEQLSEEAMERGHSTQTEALFCGASCGASVVVLTHISQRFPRAGPPIPTLSHTYPPSIHDDCVALGCPLPGATPMAVVSARDLLTVSFENAPELQRTEEAFRALLEEG